MASGWVLPFLAGAVSVVFASLVAGRWSVARRPHQLAWVLGLASYAAASFVEAYVAVVGWNAPLYRLYFPLAAGTVGLLGLGTVLLARTGPAGRAFAAFVALGILVAAFAPFASPLPEDLSLRGHGLGAKGVPFSNPGRWAFLALNVLGGLALIGGSLLSWWQTRGAGVLLIGLGALLAFSGGSLSTLFGLDVRLTFQFLGIVVMFAGYLKTREGPRTPAAARPAEA